MKGPWAPSQVSALGALDQGREEWIGRLETSMICVFSPYHAHLGDHPSQPLMIYFFIFHLLMDETGTAPPA